VSRWTPSKRSNLIRKLHRLGFDAPFTGTRHQFVVSSENRFSVGLLHSVPHAGLSRRHPGLRSAGAGTGSPRGEASGNSPYKPSAIIWWTKYG
jgi:hypothetical protein